MSPLEAIESVAESGGADLAEILAAYHAANYSITNPTGYDLGYHDTDRHDWASRLESSPRGRPGDNARANAPIPDDVTGRRAVDVTDLMIGGTLGGRVRIEQGGTFYLEVNGLGDGSGDVVTVRLDKPVREGNLGDEVATRVQVRHIASHARVEGLLELSEARECRGWLGAEPIDPAEDGSFTIEVGLFPQCPDAVVIVSSTDPAAAPPLVTHYTVTARASSTGPAVEDLGGHGISHRVVGPITGAEQVHVELDLGDVLPEPPYDPKFCVYAENGLAQGVLGETRINGVALPGEFIGEGSTGSGRYRASSTHLTRFCIDVPAALLGSGPHTFTVVVSEPVRLDAAFVSLHRTDYCVSQEPWKTEYPECDPAEGGSVWAWGANWNGQLGPNTSDGWATAPAFVGIEDAVGVAAGLTSGYALRSDGTVWAWGANVARQT